MTFYFPWCGYNGADKKKFTPKMPHKKFTPDNNNNRLVGPPRDNHLMDKLQQTQQCKYFLRLFRDQITMTLFIEINLDRSLRYPFLPLCVHHIYKLSLRMRMRTRAA